MSSGLKVNKPPSRTLLSSPQPQTDIHVGPQPQTDIHVGPQPQTDIHVGPQPQTDIHVGPQPRAQQPHTSITPYMWAFNPRVTEPPLPHPPVTTHTSGSTQSQTTPPKYQNSMTTRQSEPRVESEKCEIFLCSLFQCFSF
jgi:hypothetical protein